MGTVAKLKSSGQMILKGEINERNMSLNKTFKIRYIRDWLNGSSANAGNHWVEIQAFTRNRANVAQGKTVTGSNAITNGARIVDGSTDTMSYAEIVAGSQWVQIDLGNLYEVTEIKVWHYYNDGRTYYGTKTEVSHNGVDWYTLFDNAVNGTYVETSAGRRYIVDLSLKSHYPFDYTEKGIGNRNLLDTSVWQVGTSGTQDNFYVNGESNQIIRYPNPWGIEDVVWAGIGNDATSDAESGWNYNNHPIDNTKKYRLSVWIKRENAGNGRTYFGCQANTVYNLGTTTKNSNPYFTSKLVSELPIMAENWLLWVAYIHPYDYTGSSDPKSGIYSLDGTRVSALGDFKWASDAEYGGHRVYLYYSTSTTENQYYYAPRMEVVDGYETSIEDMISIGNDDAVNVINNTNTNYTDDGIAIEESTTNMFTQSQTNSFPVKSGKAFEVISWSDKEVIYKNNFTGEQYNYKGNDIAVVAGQDYYAQCEIFVSEDYNGNYAPYWNIEQTGSVAKFYDLSRKGTWQKFTHTFKPTANGNSRMLMYACPNNTSATSGYVLYKNPQFEAKAWGTSFVNGSRSNGNVQVSIDTGSDFTIFYKYVPDANWAVLSTQGYNRYKWFLYDKNTGKKIWYSDYHSGGTRTSSDPWLGFDEFVTNTYPVWHWHATKTHVAGKEYWFALVKNGARWIRHQLTEEGYVEHSATHTDQALIKFTPNKFELNYDYNWKCKDLTVFNKALTSEEVQSLAKGKFSVDVNGDLKTEKVEFDNEGWQLVYHGLATYSERVDPQAFVNIGDNIQFNEIKVTCPFWDYEIKAQTTKTAVLRQPLAWYAKWLNEQPDANSPKVKFHGLDGVQDVGLTNTNSILYGYGNSWRCFTPVHYVDNNTMYTGQVPAYITKHDWYNTSDYKAGMDTDDYRESGIYNLSPKEFQTVQVWVRKGVEFTNPVNVTVTGNNVQKTGGTANTWDAKAISTQTINGDCYLEATVGTAPPLYAMIGLNNSDTTASYTDLNYAIYLESNYYTIYEEGSNKGRVGNFVLGDKVAIRVANGNVTYLLNGKEVYKSLVAPPTSLFVDCSIYTSGGKLENVLFMKTSLGSNTTMNSKKDKLVISRVLEGVNRMT